jgi:hypothetical protein
MNANVRSQIGGGRGAVKSHSIHKIFARRLAVNTGAHLSTCAFNNTQRVLIKCCPKYVYVCMLPQMSTISARGRRSDGVVNRYYSLFKGTPPLFYDRCHIGRSRILWPTSRASFTTCVQRPVLYLCVGVFVCVCVDEVGTR